MKLHVGVFLANLELFWIAGHLPLPHVKGLFRSLRPMTGPRPVDG